MKKINIMLLSVLMLIANLTSAAFIDTSEKGMNELMAQTRIDVKFLDRMEVLADDYLVIDNDEELFSLFNMGDDSSIINLYFVDEINSCGVVAGFTGCSHGNSIAVTNIGIDQAELNTHELGHVLSLDHIDEVGNIMSLDDFGNTVFNDDQITAMLNSPFIQNDGESFVQIQPILVSSIPLPSSLLLFLSGIIGLYFKREKL